MAVSQKFAGILLAMCAILALSAGQTVDCGVQFTSAYLVATTTADKCAAIYKLTKCAASSGNTEWDNLLTLAQKQVDCTGVTVPEEEQDVSSIGIVANDLVFQMHADSEVVFRRFRRDTVSLFDLNQQLQTAVSDITQSVSSLQRETQAKIDTQGSTVASIATQNLAVTLSKFSEVSKGVQDEVSSRVSVITAVRGEITQTKSDLTVALSDSISVVNTDLSGTKSALAAANLEISRLKSQLASTCKFNQYKDNGVCKDHTICDLRKQYEAVAASETSNRVCVNLRECVLGETFETRSPSAISDRECSNVTVCGPNDQEAAPPTLLSNRVCIPRQGPLILGNSTSNPATSCLQILENNRNAKSGIYKIKAGVVIYDMFCDMDSFGGGWTRVARGIGGKVTCWLTAGECNIANQHVYSETFKHADATINAIPKTVYRFSGSGFSSGTEGSQDIDANYFWDATKTCKTYNHMAPATGDCNCVYETPTLSDPKKHCGNVYVNHLGLGDWGGQYGYPPDTVPWSDDRRWGSNDCLHTSHNANGWYFRKQGTKRCADGNCIGVQARCDVQLWVR